MRDILKDYKIFNIDPNQIRPKNFWEQVLKHRDYAMNRFKNSIKPRSKFACPLCKSKKANLFLAYKNYHLMDCLKCGLVSCNADFSKIAGQKVYDSKESIENTTIQILSAYEYRKKTLAPERLNYILEKTGLTEKKLKLLDMGCGPGYFISYLQDRNIRYKGLELAEFLVKICKEKGLNAERADLKNEPENFYNVVTLFDVLEHLTDPVATLKEINSKMSEEGFLVAYTPNIHSLSSLLMGENQNLLYPFQHICFFDPRSLEYLAYKTGFKIHSLEYFGLDLADYFSKKSYEDKYDYLSNLKEFIPLLQSVLDKQGKSNHMRAVLQKVN